MILRPYQNESHDALRHAYEMGKNRLGIRLFTGGGKTSGIAAFLPEKFPDLADRGVVFLSHRREILYQAYRTFKRRWGNEKWIGIEMGEYHCTGEEDFIFASVDSIGRWMGNRIGKFRHRYPGIIICDEGHHVALDGTWDNILNFFGVGSDPEQYHTFEDGSKPLSVFMTATPVRSDGQGLHPFLDEFVVDFDIAYGIREGWLCDIRAYHAELQGDDYSAFDPEQQVDFLIKTWEKWGHGMRTLGFAKNVSQSEMLAATLADRGYAAGHVDATTPDELRQEIVRRFALDYGNPEALEFMSNRLIFTEGYDNPLIQSILDNAPTDSQSLYIQKVGRGLRVDPDVDLGSYRTADQRKEAIRTSRKPFLTYITAFPLKHGLDMPATLFGLPKNVDTQAKMLSEIVDVIQNEEEELPEAPTRDLAGMDSLDIRLKRQDIWTQTVYNEELKALTPLRWIMGENHASLRLPTNPWAKGVTERTPIVIHYERGPDDRWHLHRVTEGGWIDQIKRPARAKHQDMDHVEFDIHDGIKKVDRWLQENEPSLYQMMQRDHEGPATARMIDYLKRKKVRANFEALTMETAQILKDAALITPKLKQFNLSTD